jgi:hypothetical protein
MAKSHLRLIGPDIERATVLPQGTKVTVTGYVHGGRNKNTYYRQHEYLTEKEIDQLWPLPVRAVTLAAIGC